jgi:hypothetical protein
LWKGVIHNCGLVRINIYMKTNEVVGTCHMETKQDGSCGSQLDKHNWMCNMLSRVAHIQCCIKWKALSMANMMFDSWFLRHGKML